MIRVAQRGTMARVGRKKATKKAAVTFSKKKRRTAAPSRPRTIAARPRPTREEWQARVREVSAQVLALAGLDMSAMHPMTPDEGLLIIQAQMIAVTGLAAMEHAAEHLSAAATSVQQEGVNVVRGMFRVMMGSKLANTLHGLERAANDVRATTDRDARARITILFLKEKIEGLQDVRDVRSLCAPPRVHEIADLLTRHSLKSARRGSTLTPAGILARIILASRDATAGTQQVKALADKIVKSIRRYEASLNDGLGDT